MVRYEISIAVLGRLCGDVGIARRAFACPFCSVESQTLSEEIKGADAVVLAKLVKEAPADGESFDPNSGMATFKIVEPLKGRRVGRTTTKSVSCFLAMRIARKRTWSPGWVKARLIGRRRCR